MSYILAAAQIDARVGDTRANLEKHLDFSSKARDQKASVVVFPELSLTGYTLRDLTPDVAIGSMIGSPQLEETLELSREIAIIAGGIEQTPDGRFHNVAFLFSNGELRVVHRKIYLPTYGMFEEQRYFLPGDTVRAFDLFSSRIGVLVCEDLWHPALPYLLSRDGAQILIGMSASPVRLGGDREGKLAVAETNHEHHRTYARLLSSYLVFVNRVGFEDGIGFWGGSAVFSPNGAEITRAPLFEEYLIFAEISEAEINKARRDSRHSLDDDPYLTLRELSRIVNRPQNVDIIAKI
jgi:NAD+ synthase (glutamine-hydrolysing)